LDGKSWASLKKTVTFTIIKDGIKCKYVCFKGESFIDYDLVKQEVTTEENGVLFELPIADWSEYMDLPGKPSKNWLIMTPWCFLLMGTSGIIKSSGMTCFNGALHTAL
jgi:hypothetical protein